MSKKKYTNSMFQTFRLSEYFSSIDDRECRHLKYLMIHQNSKTTVTVPLKIGFFSLFKFIFYDFFPLMFIQAYFKN